MKGHWQSNIMVRLVTATGLNVYFKQQQEPYLYFVR